MLKSYTLVVFESGALVVFESGALGVFKSTALRILIICESESTGILLSTEYK